MGFPRMAHLQYYSTASAATATDMSRQYIHQQIKDGNLRAVNIAPPGARARYRIAEEDLRAFMERGAVEAAS